MKNIVYIFIIAFIMAFCADKPKGVTLHTGQSPEEQKENLLTGSYLAADTDAGAFLPAQNYAPAKW